MIARCLFGHTPKLQSAVRHDWIATELNLTAGPVNEFYAAKF